jgi:hypothetical protein
MIAGVCRPNPILRGTLQCVPKQPQKSNCIHDPFACDRLNATPIDICQTRNPRTGVNTKCAIQISHTMWDPNGLCVKGQCSEAVPVAPPKTP